VSISGVDPVKPSNRATALCATTQGQPALWTLKKACTRKTQLYIHDLSSLTHKKTTSVVGLMS